MDIERVEDLSELSNDQLDELEAQAVEAFDELRDGDLDAETIQALDELAGEIERIRGEKATRDEAAAQAAEAVAALTDRVHPTQDGEDDGDDLTIDAEVIDDAAEAVEHEAVAAAGAKHDPRDDLPTRAKLNLHLSDVRRRAPAVKAPEPEAVILASADVPGFTAGGRIPDRRGLANAIHSRARGLGATSVGAESANYIPVASIPREYEVTLSERSSLAEVTRALRQVADPAALTAGGGWCAPSETLYDFFDITCEDGEIDLPTTGIERGGVRFPASPSLSDVFTGSFTNATNPWLWTESDDILTVTGSTNKPCVRVPCPTFSDVRLECYGICLTAGNLMSDAYPEAIEHQMGLLMSALHHATNARYIAQMVSCITGSSIVTGSSSATEASQGVAAPLLGNVELQISDIRERFGMCATDVLEVVLPRFALGMIRSDLAKRNGVDLLDVTNAQIAAWFDRRSARTQFVGDWQIRAAGQIGGETPITNWPDNVNFLVYPAGWFLRGNGLMLNLGVVRDSVLNAENDHTALWMEECHLIACVGPAGAARNVFVDVCPSGVTGAQPDLGCNA